MVGMMILKGTYMEIYFLGLIILATCVYFWYIYKTYEPLASQLPFDMATALDLDQQNDPDELAGAEEYIQVRDNSTLSAQRAGAVLCRVLTSMPALSPPLPRMRPFYIRFTPVSHPFHIRFTSPCSRPCEKALCVPR